MDQPLINFFAGKISDLLMLSLKLKASDFLFDFDITAKSVFFNLKCCVSGG